MGNWEHENFGNLGRVPISQFPNVYARAREEGVAVNIFDIVLPDTEEQHIMDGWDPDSWVLPQAYRPCKKNRYQSEEAAESAIWAHAQHKNWEESDCSVQYCTSHSIPGWHIIHDEEKS